DFVWGLIASMYLGNIVGLLVVLSTVPLFAAILRIPFSIIAPVIIVICAIGAYTVHNAMLDVWYMLPFGVSGYVFKKIDIPLAKDVALQLADRMGLAVMRYEVVDRVAGEMNLPKSLVGRLRVGKAGFRERMTTDQRSIAMYTADELFALAEKGNVVLRGWGAT